MLCRCLRFSTSRQRGPQGRVVRTSHGPRAHRRRDAKRPPRRAAETVQDDREGAPETSVLKLRIVTPRGAPSHSI